MTKLELEKRVAELEEKLSKVTSTNELKERINNYAKREKQMVQENFDNRRKFETAQKTIDSGRKEYEKLSSKFNELAALFDKVLSANNDILETNKLFLRNALRVQELLNIKITAFNGGEGEK